MLKKLVSCLSVFVFLAFIAVMTLLLLFGHKESFSENEKRNLAAAPTVSPSAIMGGKTQAELESYTSDHIPGRNFYVGVHAYWNLLLGRNTAQSIYHCRDGYLINAPEDADNQIFADNLARFDAFAGSVGIPADLIMVPDTGYLMEDVLPRGHGEYQDDALYEQAARSMTHIRLLDVRQSLKDGLAGGQVCYRTDHHLTSYGSWLLYRDYRQSVNDWFRGAKEDYTVTSHDGFYGTTWSGSGYWRTKPDTVEMWDSGCRVQVSIRDGGAEPAVYDSMFFPSHLEALDQYPVFLDGNHSMVTIENPTAPDESLLILRDSYGHCFAPFLAEHYRTIYLIDMRYYRESVSAFLAEHPVNRMLFLYGMDSMQTDTNSALLS